MMPHKFDRILGDCLLRMDRGESLMDILAVYPSLADKIKPLLMVAMLSRALPQPVPGYTALREGKNQMLAEMASMQAEDSFIKPKPLQPARERTVDRWIGSLKKLQPAYRFAMLSLVVVLAGGFFTLSASASGFADDIMQTIFFSFEQVGDLLLVRPSPPKGIGENPILTSDFDLPNFPPEYSGDFRGLMVDEQGQNNNEPGQPGEGTLSQIQTREYSFGTKYDDQIDLADEVLGVEEANDIDEKALEKEAKEEEKDLEKDVKEEEKDAAKVEKEDEKDKDKDKEEKEDEKDAVKEEKEDEKDKDKEDKDKDK